MTIDDKLPEPKKDKSFLPLECLGYQRPPHHYESPPKKRGTFEPYCPSCQDLKKFDEED